MKTVSQDAWKQGGFQEDWDKQESGKIAEICHTVITLCISLITFRNYIVVGSGDYHENIKPPFNSFCIG